MSDFKAKMHPNRFQLGVVGLPVRRMFNKEVITKHLKVENYSVILQKEFAYYGP